MAVTAAGTGYSRTVYTTSAGETGVKWVPDGVQAGAPLLMYCHGNPGIVQDSADQEFQYTAFTEIREWCLDRGWVMGEAHAGGSSWGNDTARNGYRALYNDLAAQIGGIGPIVIIGRSMGGLVGAYLATLDPVIAPKTLGFMCLSGTLDLAYRYSIATGDNKTLIEAAYGGANTQAAFNAASAGHDPMLFPAGTWTGRNAIQQYATGDVVVDDVPNALAWLDKYGPELAIKMVQETAGGDHNSSTDNPAQRDASLSFLGTIWTPPAPPAPTVAYLVHEMYYVGTGGTLYTMTPA
ncbi:esterase [Arthrobacter phage Mendel]|uniref:Esterase n=1 Tax=Arthrobacter phage Mendel TaxID=2484218 RepID=A0A3G3M0H0_9CAUD|nr:esterase [Arthrobacter phage Mendel]AYQ99938.1 esterase [Arthrobacter phage Mendel]